MRAKLIKQNGIGIQTVDGVDYYLVLNDKIYNTNPLTSELSNGGKLSKQNCDEEFAKAMGVVDVEKLADSFFEKESSNMLHPQHQMRNFFILGFNKAMELNRDKVFTLEDMMNCWNKALKFQEHKQTLGEYIQSLQQPSEIDVEIETETKVWDFISNGEFESFEIIPKLDSEGCLILKKI
jgi:hypothetical protein